MEAFINHISELQIKGMLFEFFLFLNLKKKKERPIMFDQNYYKSVGMRGNNVMYI